ncbi:large ribosomal subunit protein bL12m-like [Mytilus edulis]|uniref:Large ribosomal subunit protein bL12m n=1 Tax=Mytilus edulis TaxID=6550 RepID=A0A8S3SKF7_MYTED|nr:MRPL12 [Mytilus edulis]
MASRRLIFLSSKLSRNIHRISRRDRVVTCSSCSTSRLYSTLPEPVIDGQDKVFPPKLHTIVDDIGKLTLTEVADLNELLKKTLRIQDAPVMAMGMPGMAAPKEEEEEEAPKIVKTLFSLKLLEFAADKKITLIKEIKSLVPDMNLVQAKKFVESAPQVIKADITKEEAETLKKAIEAAGGKCDID